MIEQSKNIIQPWIDRLLIVLIAAVPLSVNLRFFNDKIGLTVFTEPICLILAGLIILLLFNNRNKIQLHRGDYLILSLIGALFLSSLTSWNFIISMKHNIIIGTHILAAYTGYRNSSQSEKFHKNITRAFIGGHALLALFCFINALKLGIFYETSYWIAKPFIEQGHSNLSILLEAPALLSILVLFGYKCSKTEKLLLVISLGLFISVIGFSCSRTSYLTFLISGTLTVLFLFLKDKNWRILIYISIPIILTAGLWKVNNLIHEQRITSKSAEGYNIKDVTTYKQTDMYDEMSKIGNTKNRAGKSSNERVNRWKTGIELWSKTPTLGIGSGCFADRYQAIQLKTDDPFSQKLASRKMNIHNLYLGWLVEGGILTFIAGIYLLFNLIFVGFKTLLNKQKTLPNRGSLLLFLPFLIHGIVQDYSNEPRVTILFWVGVAYLFCNYFKSEQTTNVKSST